MNIMRDIKGLIFDKDGTLFDFAATWESWAKAFVQRLCAGDADRAARMADAMGFDMETSKFAPDSVVIASTADQIAVALSPLFPTMTVSELLGLINEEASRAPQRQAVPLMPLLTLFQDNGLRLGVATNDAEAPARAHLAQAGVTQMFEFIAGFDSGHGGKPAPGQLLAFAEKTGIACQQIAMVGDSTHDLRAGRAAGMVTVGVLTGLAPAADLAPFADVIMPDIGGLPAWLAGASTTL